MEAFYDSYPQKERGCPRLIDRRGTPSIVLESRCGLESISHPDSYIAWARYAIYSSDIDTS